MGKELDKPVGIRQQARTWSCFSGDFFCWCSHWWILPPGNTTALLYDGKWKGKSQKKKDEFL
jgi:hypothetical protein